MTTSRTIPSTFLLRPADDADLDVIAALWHRGWRDAHLGHVPPELLEHRRLSDLRALLPSRLPATTVAESESGIVGFVTVDDDQIEQLYVDRSARGTGVAATLLGYGETVIARAADQAWLAVVPGNARARRFYERNGWSDAGHFDNAAPTLVGPTIPVPSHRYEKDVTS